MSWSSLIKDLPEDIVRKRTSDERTTIPESSRENVRSESSRRSTTPESSRENVRSEVSKRSTIPDSSRESVRSEYSKRKSTPDSSREHVRSEFSGDTRRQRTKPDSSRETVRSDYSKRTQSEETLDSRHSKSKLKAKRASFFQKSHSKRVSWQSMDTGGDGSRVSRPSADLRGVEQGRRKTLSFQQDFDVNQYITKKTVTCGMMDVALMMSNAAQLKMLLDVGTENPTYYLLLALVLASIVLQVAVGVIFMVTGKSSITRLDKQLQRNKWNNAATMGVFFITVINILTNTFGISSSPPAVQSH